MPTLGFNPLAQTNAPGVALYVENLIPYENGLEAAPTILDQGKDAVAAAVTGSFLGQKLDASYRVFAGTGTKLYEQSGAGWTDRSVGAGSYTASSVWSFCQFGDYTLAANLSDAVQASASGAFAALTGIKAKIIESVVTGAGGFVFAFDTDTTAFGHQQDRFYTSALNDHTDWTPSIATQCTTARLVGSGGPIVAAKKFGADSIVAYKTSGLFHGRYIGGDAGWTWAELPEIGCVGMRAVCDIGFAHFIVASSGFYIYDGARPVPIGLEVRDWFFANASYADLSKVECQYDLTTRRVFVFFKAAGASSLNKALVYNTVSQQWGLMDCAIESSLFFVAPGATWATATGTWATATGTWAGDPPGKKLLAVFGTDHKIGTLTGNPGTSKFQTADMGDKVASSRLTEVYVDYQARPTTASVSLYSSYGLGGTQLVGPNVTAYDSPASGIPGRFTLRQTARWHRAEFTFSGSTRVTGYGAKLAQAGDR